MPELIEIEPALPVPVRMDADERFTGRGVTIAFLDSGFYAHKDLTEPVNRIVAYHNIFSPRDDISSLQAHDVASWHGMMTSVVAAGNGYLSEGLYRSIAPEARVVLVKIGRTGRIPESNIETGLRWVLTNKDKYDIRVVNISAGGVLPMCQDTGTAIIMGKKGRLVFTDGDDEAALAEGARDAYLKRNLRYSQLTPISMFEEKNTKSNMPAQVEVYAEGLGRRHLTERATA